MIQVLIVEPGKPPRQSKIKQHLTSMQNVVGGTIQVLYPFEEPVALICNDEGKLLGLPANRALRDSEGNLYDIVCGTFFLCGAPPGKENFSSLTAEQRKRYQQKFLHPEFFLNLGGEILCLPL